ncbi:hypothetical protein TRVL_01289 [Trypanosoma vivax]|nr:hypothetical protein TRVL_01289 [Trypanosoma vivax]
MVFLPACWRSRYVVRCLVTVRCACGLSSRTRSLSVKPRPHHISVCVPFCPPRAGPFFFPLGTSSAVLRVLLRLPHARRFRLSRTRVRSKFCVRALRSFRRIIMSVFPAIAVSHSIACVVVCGGCLCPSFSSLRFYGRLSAIGCRTEHVWTPMFAQHQCVVHEMPVLCCAQAFVPVRLRVAPCRPLSQLRLAPVPVGDEFSSMSSSTSVGVTATCLVPQAH